MSIERHTLLELLQTILRELGEDLGKVFEDARGELRRGYQVYSEVCSGCHSMSQLSYRNLYEEWANDKYFKLLYSKDKILNSLSEREIFNPH